MLPQVGTADANSERAIKLHAGWVWQWLSICVSGGPLTECFPWLPRPPCKPPWTQMLCSSSAVFLPCLCCKRWGWSGSQTSHPPFRTPESHCSLSSDLLGDLRTTDSDQLWSLRNTHQILPFWRCGHLPLSSPIDIWHLGNSDREKTKHISLRLPERSSHKEFRDDVQRHQNQAVNKELHPLWTNYLHQPLQRRASRSTEERRCYLPRF